MKKTIFLIALTGSFLFGFAQSKHTVSNQEIALKYIETYGNWDIDKLSTFWSNNIYFEDPTGSIAFEKESKTIGKKNVSEALKKAFNDKIPDFVNITVNHSFSYGSYAVINYTFESTLEAKWFKKEATGNVFTSIPVTTILTIENGLVTKHIDYADYTKFFEQINAQLDIK